MRHTCHLPLFHCVLITSAHLTSLPVGLHRSLPSLTLSLLWLQPLITIALKCDNRVQIKYRQNFPIFQIRNVRTVPKIFSLHVMQSSMLLAHSSHATKCRHGRNNVWTRVRLHFRHVISERNRSFSFFSSALSEKYASTANMQTLSLKSKIILYAKIFSTNAQILLQGTSGVYNIGL